LRGKRKSKNGKKEKREKIIFLHSPHFLALYGVPDLHVSLLGATFSFFLFIHKEIQGLED
jgi:hypothetical protein